MHKTEDRIERALAGALKRTDSHGAPPTLAAAIRHAVFPGGARIRPHLCLAVAAACGDSDPLLADASAAAIELLHCASLVHDDMPCFDAALTRRGRPSVHVAYGERSAVLAGDALIVMAFETLAAAAVHHPLRLVGLVTALARRAGMPNGIVAGQAWECEDWVALPDYQRAKTGSLFAAATEMGALAAGGNPEGWLGFGDWLGQAYQVADDIRDAAASAEDIGKPVGRDRSLGRPSAVAEFGLAGALEHFEDLVARASDAVPPGRSADRLRALLHSEVLRLLPPPLKLQARALAVA